MRSFFLFICIGLYFLVNVNAYPNKRNDDEDVMLVHQLRRLIQHELREQLFEKEKRIKTQEELDNEVLLEYCRIQCKYLRVNDSNADDAARQPYKDCRRDCVHENLKNKQEHK